MTGDDDTDSRSAGVDVEFREIMDDVDEYVTHSDQLGRGEVRRPRLRVVVASDCNQRSHDGEFIENLRLADITAMNDVVAAHEKRARVRPQKPVGIRNKSDAKLIVGVHEISGGGWCNTWIAPPAAQH